MRTTDISALVPSRTAAPTPQRMATRGTVATPPAGIADDTVTVTLPSYSADYGWPCRWIRQGNTLPAIGAECLVLWDEMGAGTVVQWAGAGVAMPTVADVAALAAAPPQARVYNTAAVPITNGGAGTFLTFDTERWDNGDLHSTSALTGRLTVPIAGLYSIGACVEFAASAGGAIRQVALRINGATFIDASNPGPSGTAAVQASVSTDYRLAAGDYVEVRAFQDSGGALNVQAVGNYSPEFWIVRHGPST